MLKFTSGLMRTTLFPQHQRHTLSEQQETIHMIQMLRKEACSGAIADLSHVRTEHCLADCLTKRSANPKNLLTSVQTGWLKEIVTRTHLSGSCWITRHS